MILTDLEGLAEQVALTPGLTAALSFLQGLKEQDLTDGRIDIDGDMVFALVQSYETLAGIEWVFEGHRKYLDIQYLAAGEELLGWAHADQVTITSPYDESADAWLGTMPAGQITRVRLAPGQLAVFYPSDGHAPKHAAGAPAAVKKVIVKVAVGR